MTGRQGYNEELQIRAPRRKSRSLYPPSFAALLVYALLLALAVGFGSAYWMTSGPFPLSEVRIGPWQYWPNIGSSNTDPYAKAMIARDAFLPLATGEGLELTTVRDSVGNPLRSSCSYRIGPTMPAARYWTLTLYDPKSRLPVQVTTQRSGITSREIVRNENGEFSINLSQQVKPGNWLQLPQDGDFRLVLRLYDIPASIDGTTIDHRLLPTIDQLGCLP